jgi:putative transposase
LAGLALAVVMDLFSRRIVGLSTAPTPRRELALDAVMLAVRRRPHARNTESFFACPKDERIKKRIYDNRDQAIAEVSDCIDSFYNPVRRHRQLSRRQS